MIIETLVTTLDADGNLNVAPMGVVIESPEFSTFELRPFRSTQTYENLQASRCGVMHITDDCGLIARTALGLPHGELSIVSASQVEGSVLTACCRAFEFEVKFIQQNDARASVFCSVLATHRFRDFVGIHRAAYAVIEGAILASRIPFLPESAVMHKLADLETIVEKTGSRHEREVFQEIQQFVAGEPHRLNSVEGGSV